MVPPPVFPLSGEFEPLAGIMLGCNEMVRFHPEIFVAIMRALPPSLPVVAVVGSRTEGSLVTELLVRHRIKPDTLYVAAIRSNSMWIRDYGPIFVRRRNGAVAIVDGEYVRVDQTHERAQDDNVPRQIAEIVALPKVDAPLRMEGGNILTNGEGLCVSTSSLIAGNRFRGYDTSAIGRILGAYFGFSRWTYVPRLQGEPTGHADMFICFLAADVVLVGRMDPSVDPVNARILDEAARNLAAARTSRGPMQVHRIPMPPRSGPNWRSYTNAILASGVALVPIYSDVDATLQDEALELYATLLPGWKVVGINVDSMVGTRGYLHCVSVNIPKFVDLGRVKGRRTPLPPLDPRR